MLRFVSIKGLKIPKQIKVPEDWDMSVQYLMTMIYQSESKTFFFGRSARSSMIPLKMAAGSAWASELGIEDFLYMHTNLDKKEPESKIKLVIEAVIVASKDTVKGGKESKYLSGGYGVFDIFTSSRSGATLDLLAGTPRDLISGEKSEPSSA
jgi:hypothetical protein